MDFDRFKKEVGFGLAYALCEEKLGPQHFTGLEFDEWLKIYRSATKGSPLKRKAACALSKLALNFEQYLELTAVIEEGVYLVAISKISDLAVSLHELARAYTLVSDPKRKEVLGLKIKGFDCPFEEVKKTYDNFLGIDLRALLLECAKRNASAFEDWHWFYKETYYSQPSELIAINKQAFSEMFFHAGKHDSWRDVFDRLNKGGKLDDELRNKILMKMYLVSASFEHYLYIFIYARDELRGKSFDNAYSQLKDFKQGWDLYCHTFREEDADRREKMILALAQLPGEPEDILKIYYTRTGASMNSPGKEALLAKISSLKLSRDGWMKIFDKADDDLRGVISEKIKEFEEPLDFWKAGLRFWHKDIRDISLQKLKEFAAKEVIF